MSPPYDEGDERVRGTTTYPPGAKENGGIFCHANTWAIVAAAKLGQGDARLPVLPADHALRARPDVDAHEGGALRLLRQHRRAASTSSSATRRNAWLSGTAAWTYVAATQWILGIRPTYRGPASRAGDPGRTGLASPHSASSAA